MEDDIFVFVVKMYPIQIFGKILLGSNFLYVWRRSYNAKYNSSLGLCGVPIYKPYIQWGSKRGTETEITRGGERREEAETDRIAKKGEPFR